MSKHYYHVLDTYPKLSETFIRREIDKLTDDGLEVTILAIKREKLPGTSRQYVIYAEKSWKQFEKALLILLCIKPLNVLKGLLAIGMSFFVSFRFARLQLAAFYHAVMFQREMEKKGVEIAAEFAYITADIAYFLAKFHNIDYSLSIHAWDIFAQPKKELNVRLQRATTIRCCSQFAKTYIQQTIGGIGKEIVVAYHPTPIKIKQKQRKEERKGFLFIGRLEEKKGCFLLFHAFRQFIENGGDEILTIIGRGRKFKALKALKYQLGLDNHIVFKGELSHKKAMRYLASTKALILPCLVAKDGDCDGIPNVIREAIIYETFVITTAVGGIIEIIEHNKNGYIVPTNNCIELTKSLVSLS